MNNIKLSAMNVISKLLFVFIILQNTISAQVCDCLKVSNIKDSYNAFSEYITFSITNNCDSTIKCIISVQSYRYKDSSWVETWPDIYLKKITVCKPASLIVTIPVDSIITKQWCPKDCIDYFGSKWTEININNVQENDRVVLCRFAFYMFNVDKWKLERKPFYFSEPFCVVIVP